MTNVLFKSGAVFVKTITGLAVIETLEKISLERKGKAMKLNSKKEGEI
jgi:hypothetical protein